MTVSVVLISLTALILTGVFSGVTKKAAAIQSRYETHQDLAEAQRFIRRLGRVAKSCVITSVGTNQALDCDVDFASPPKGVITKTRFVQNGSSLLYQHQEAGSIWKTKATYRGIKSFSVCDAAKITAGSCALPGKSFEVFANTVSPRFFRFEILALDAKKGDKGERYHGAFYVRNPTPFGASIVYQWSEF